MEFAGYSGDGGPATAAELNWWTAVTVDSAGKSLQSPMLSTTASAK